MSDAVSWQTWVVLAGFWGLLLGALAVGRVRASVLAKSPADWTLDVSGLLVQGVVVPWLQVLVIAGALSWALPAGRNALDLPGPAAFLLAFAGVDYLYYWNHRWLHRPRVWPVHVVHHTVTDMDVLGTSRNTLWSSALIVYLWAHGAMLYLLANPVWYAAGVALTSVLDLWRHSPLQPGPNAARVLGLALVLPADHARHHASQDVRVNFGANLSWWDRMHGTWHAGEAADPTLGVALDLPLARRLLWPFP